MDSDAIWKEEKADGTFTTRFPDYPNSGGTLDTTFSPQNMPAERIIGRYFTNWQ